ELKGFELDIKELEKKLKIPVVPMIATKGEGIVELLDIILSHDIEKESAQIGFISSQKVIKKYESEIANILRKIDKNGQLKDFDYSWLSLKTLEQDKIVLDLIDQIILEKTESFSLNYNPSWKQINQVLNSFKEKATTGDTAVFIANERYRIVSNIIENVIIKEGKASSNVTTMLDEVLTDKYLGIPIFLASLWALFTFTFTLSEPFVLIIETFFNLFIDLISKYVPDPNIASFFVGVLNGLGAIAVFIPNIFLLYFGMAVIEDSGWLARAAFVADKWLEKIGLHGKSFIPLMLGFGCTVPAIMATRSIRNKEDRMITLAITPFISCAARLPVYVLFAGIFFPDFAALAILSMYVIGIAVAVVLAKILNTFFYRHEDHTFIMELPEFQRPLMKTATREMWLQGSLFLKKAGKIIFLASLFVWVLSNLPFGVPINDTYLAVIGKTLEPLFSPFGWTWVFISALILGLIAKEVIVATLGILGGLSLSQFIVGAMTVGQAFSFMVFVLLYTPCFATVAIIKAETRSWKTTLILSIGYIIIAYGVALIFRIGLLALGIS
ncbi:MAG: ferrous iron transport protein B, partial [Candidatus Heimdallarchaeota archaeon]|nr:ferrous iron transport protein B [Candidatus Heimdallarchaeota archaeon]